MNTFENTRTAAQFFQGSLAYRLEQVAGKVTEEGELSNDTLIDLRILAEVLNQFNALIHTVAVADATNERLARERQLGA
jgi:hypothetical protein